MKIMPLLATAILYFIGLPFSTQAMPVSAINPIAPAQAVEKPQKSKELQTFQKSRKSLEKHPTQPSQQPQDLEKTQSTHKPPIVHQPSLSSKKINLNQADASTLVKVMKDVGKKKAEAVVYYRKEHGPFSSFEDLSKVKGFSSKFIKKHLTKWQKSLTLS